MLGRRAHAQVDVTAPRLYLVAGPMRTGKSIIAARFNRLSGISSLSGDDLIHMLGLAAPGLGISHRELDKEMGKKRWRLNRDRLAPFVEAFAELRVWRESPIIIEGVLHPESVQRLMRRYPGVCRGCFVGNATVTPAVKVEHLLEHSKLSPKDWLRGKPAAELAAYATEIIEASLEYRDAAGALGIPYFELSPDFEAGVSQVVTYLKDGSLPKARVCVAFAGR
jgi:hypothetical protein